MAIVSYRTHAYKKAFSLAETLAALMIGAMVLVTVLGIYGRAQNSALAVMRKLDESQLPDEILQRIAEDLDGIVAASKDTRIIIVGNKIEKGFQGAKLEIRKTIYNNKNIPQTFERIVWQTAYDFENDVNGLVLYRAHSGMTVEDKLLDEKRQLWEKDYYFIPICDGVTYFKIQVPAGENFQDRWNSTTLPNAVTVTISFAELFETDEGSYDIEETEKHTRTIGIDKSRNITFTIPKKKPDDLSRGQAPAEQTRRPPLRPRRR